MKEKNAFKVETHNISPENLVAAFGGSIENGQWIAPETKEPKIEPDVWEYYYHSKNIAYFRHPSGNKFGIEYDLETVEGSKDFEFIKNLGYGAKLKVKANTLWPEHTKINTIDFKGIAFPSKE